MKIDGLQPQDVYKSFMSSTVRSDTDGNADKKAVPDVNSDRVEISSECADLSQARELVKQSGITSDKVADASSRNEKVEALRSQVESGEYSVPSKEVAKSILTGRYLDSMA